MNTHRHLWSLKVGILSLLLLLADGVPGLVAQEMQHSMDLKEAKPSTRLTIEVEGGKHLAMNGSDLAAMPHKTVTVLNGHSKTSETYSGVELADLLGKLGVPLGEQLRGKAFMTGVIAEGTDGYKVLYSLAEVDPAMHAGDVIVADTLNGQKLGNDGAFKLVSTEDKRPARWVRNLSMIEVVNLKHLSPPNNSTQLK